MPMGGIVFVTFPSGKSDMVVEFRCGDCRVITTQTVKTSAHRDGIAPATDHGEAA